MPTRTFLAINERRDHFLHGKSPKSTSFTRASTLRGPDLLAAVQSDDQWLRYGAASALRTVPLDQRAKVGTPLLSAPQRATRVRAARALVGLVPLTPRQLHELEEAELANAFRGEAWLNLGMTAWALGDRQQAEAHFRRGLQVEPDFAPLIINLADLVRGDEGRLLLEQALKSNGQWQTSIAYALGLARWRAKDKVGALNAFRIARLDGDPAHVNAWRMAEREVTDAGE